MKTPKPVYLSSFDKIAIGLLIMLFVGTSEQHVGDRHWMWVAWTAICWTNVAALATLALLNIGIEHMISEIAVARKFTRMASAKDYDGIRRLRNKAPWMWDRMVGIPRWRD